MDENNKEKLVHIQFNEERQNIFDNINNQTKINSYRSNLKIADFNKNNSEFISLFNEFIEENLSKMYFYFSLVENIARENNITNIEKLEEIEMISLKFKKSAQNLHKKINDINIDNNVNSSKFIKNDSYLVLEKSSFNHFNNDNGKSKSNNFEISKMEKKLVFNKSNFNEIDFSVNKNMNVSEFNSYNDDLIINSVSKNLNRVEKSKAKLEIELKNEMKRFNVFSSSLLENSLKYKLKNVILNIIAIEEKIILTMELGIIIIVSKKSILENTCIIDQILEDHKFPVYCIEKINKNDFITGEWSSNGVIIIWKYNSLIQSYYKSFSLSFKLGISFIGHVNDNRIPIGFVNGDIRFISTKTYKVDIILIGCHNKEIRAIALLGSFIASSSRDREIKVWNTNKKNKSEFVFNQEHKGWVNCLLGINLNNIDLNNDLFLVSGSGDTSDPIIKIWKLGCKNSIKSLLFHSDYIIYLSFDNGNLISASKDGSIKVIKIDFNQVFNYYVNKKTKKENISLPTIELVDEIVISENIDKIIKFDEYLCDNKGCVNNNVNYDWKNNSFNEEDEDIKNLFVNDKKVKYIVCNWNSSKFSIY